MNQPKFSLSRRRNQSGQVAIFVALIFQVIFVFFALLINIGLIVHHKINLQQSVDMAAYYGAMKQAEQLNAIAHVNYQLRQAWKLLAWRYRIVGTFGLKHDTPANPMPPLLPVTIPPTGPSVINSASSVDGNTCMPDDMNPAKFPYFCISHMGMNGWPNNENICKINCQVMRDVGAFTVPAVQRMQTVIDNGISGAVNAKIDAVNANLQDLCEKVTPVNARLLAKMLLSYRREMLFRTQTIEMLAANLSNEPERLIDLDGKPVKTGAVATLRNNLTEANNTSLNVGNIRMYNGFQHDSCKFKTSGKPGMQDKDWLQRIEFAQIQFMLQTCDFVQNGGSNQWQQNLRTGSLFNTSMTDLSNGEMLGSFRAPKVKAAIGTDPEQEIMRLISIPKEKFTVGYEKDPWCQSYFYVSAQSEPVIPFLPLATVKMTAEAVAKPFGGTIGPWYGRTWKSGDQNTYKNLLPSDTSSLVDKTLPIIADVTGGSIPKKDQERLFMNFSRYVGDEKGLSDPTYIAEYHAALINRVPDAAASGLPLSPRSEPTANSTQNISPTPSFWPALSSWDDTYEITDITNYDPLSKRGSESIGLRDLEISAIAPNQFDITYYSIDPDFYNNFYVKLHTQSIFDEIKSKAGIGPANKEGIRPDFGNNPVLYKIKDFGVRNQVEVVKKVFANGTFNTGLGSPSFISTFNFLVQKQSSLLTGWTFKHLGDFANFPSTSADMGENTMAFGSCLDTWNKDNFDTPLNSGLPPVPGNCVTGGRTGYSVKLISPEIIRNDVITMPLGGSLGGTSFESGKLKNPLPADLLNF